MYVYLRFLCHACVHMSCICTNTSWITHDNWLDPVCPAHLVKLLLYINQQTGSLRFFRMTDEWTEESDERRRILMTALERRILGHGLHQSCCSRTDRELMKLSPVGELYAIGLWPMVVLMLVLVVVVMMVLPLVVVKLMLLLLAVVLALVKVVVVVVMMVVPPCWWWLLWWRMMWWWWSVDASPADGVYRSWKTIHWCQLSLLNSYKMVDFRATLHSLIWPNTFFHNLQWPSQT